MSQLYDPYRTRITYLPKEEVLDTYWTFAFDEEGDGPVQFTSTFIDAFENWIWALMDEFVGILSSDTYVHSAYTYNMPLGENLPPFATELGWAGATAGGTLPSDSTWNITHIGSLTTGNRTRAIQKVSGVPKTSVNGGVWDPTPLADFIADIAPLMLAPIVADGRSSRLAIMGNTIETGPHVTKVDNVAMSPIVGSNKPRIPNRPQKSGAKRPTP